MRKAAVEARPTSRRTRCPNALGFVVLLALTACSAEPAPEASESEEAVATTTPTLLPGEVFREIGYAPMSDGVRLAYIAYRATENGQYPIISRR